MLYLFKRWWQWWHNRSNKKIFKNDLNSCFSNTIITIINNNSWKKEREREKKRAEKEEERNEQKETWLTVLLGFWRLLTCFCWIVALKVQHTNEKKQKIEKKINLKINYFFQLTVFNSSFFSMDAQNRYVFIWPFN